MDHESMQKNMTRFFLIVAFFVALGQMASAIPYVVAKNYIVDVEVRNNAAILIPGAKVKCWLSDRVIFVKASASGYVSKTIGISVEAPTGFFKRDFMLADVEKRLVAQDSQGKKLASVYFQKDQYGFAPNVYGVTAYIPKAVWLKASLQNVEIVDDFWGAPLKRECGIEEIEEFYKIRMTTKRSALDWTGSNWAVIFRSTREGSDSISPVVLSHWVDNVAKAEKQKAALPPGTAGDIAEMIWKFSCPNDVAQILQEKECALLAAFLARQQKFADLHREKNNL
jgi:hypothetical protein